MADIETIRAVWGYDYTVAGRKTLPVEAYNATVTLAQQDIRALLAEVAALRGALAALTATDPIDQHSGADFACRWCETDTSPWASLRAHVVHADDCPWVVARALLAGARADGEGR